MSDCLREGDHVACVRPGDAIITRVTEVHEDGTVALQSFPGRWRQQPGGRVTVTIPGAGTFDRVEPHEVDDLASRVVLAREVAALAEDVFQADPRDIPESALSILTVMVRDTNRNRDRRLAATV